MKLNEPGRNRPAEKGGNEDPNIRDQSAIQPGVNTISSSSTDKENKELTKTGAADFRKEDDFDANADAVFDEIGGEG